MGEGVNIFDIAREAGVSIATVSRVVSGGASVRPATREKVMRVVDKYGFKPNMLATGLSKRKTHTLGLVLPLIENPFYTKLCLAAQQQAQQMGHDVVLYQLTRGTPLDQGLMDNLIGKRLDGVVFSGDITSDTTAASMAACMGQLQRYMSVVVISPAVDLPDCPCLCSDLASAMRVALRHLARLGHKRIAMTGGTGPCDRPDTREFAYPDEMRAMGLESYICQSTLGETAAHGELCISQMLSSVSRDERPTAIVTFNDLVALGAIKQLKAMGLSVPRDMAVVGCDNLFFAPYIDPPLTSVDLRIEETARQAIRLLVEPPAGEPRGFAQWIEPTLVVRESCGATRR